MQVEPDLAVREPNSAYREIGDMSIDDGASDAEIVTRSLQAPSVFAVLFDRHAAAVHQYARRRAGSGVADDVMAETFLVAFDKRHRFDPAVINARPWLLGIATRLLARHARAESRRWAAYARAAPRAGIGSTSTWTRSSPAWMPSHEPASWPVPSPTCTSAIETCCCCMGSPT